MCDLVRPEVSPLRLSTQLLVVANEPHTPVASIYFWAPIGHSPPPPHLYMTCVFFCMKLKHIKLYICMIV